MKPYFLIAWIFFSPLGLLWAGAKPEAVPILILPFENASKEKDLDDLQTQFPDILTAYLAPFGDRIVVLDRSHLDPLALESALSLEGHLTPEAQAKIPQWSQARFLLRGSYLVTGPTLHVKALLFDTETTRLQKTFEVSGARKQVSRVVELLAAQMAPFFSSTIKPLPDLPTDNDPETQLNFIQGIGYFVNGQYPLAYPEFMKIIRRHPRHALAHYWLARSFDQGGLKDQARVEYEMFLEQFPRHPKTKECRTALQNMKKMKE